MTSPALPDTSLLSHALIPTQQTAEASEALRQALNDDVVLFATATVMVEFLSLLRKLTNKGTLSTRESDVIRQRLSATIAAFLPITEHDAHAGYLVAARLGQSDTFDATGYVLAQRHGVEFWVSDRRFANSASAAGLTGIRLFA